MAGIDSGRGCANCRWQMQKRYSQQYGLSDYDAGVLTADRATAEFFDRR